MATAPDPGGLAARHGRLPADVLVHDPAGVSRYASPAAVELLGLAGETLGALAADALCARLALVELLAHLAAHLRVRSVVPSKPRPAEAPASAEPQAPGNSARRPEPRAALCRAPQSARHSGCRVLAGRETPLGAQPRLQLRQLALQGIVGRRGAGLARRGRDQHARWLAGIRGRRRERRLWPQDAQ